jgi:corrinoid protein of di/trimethylamine methyltransferase
MACDLELLYSKMAASIVLGDEREAVRLAKEATTKDLDLKEVLDKGFSKGIREVGKLWENGDYFLPELMRSAEVMKAAMKIILPKIKNKKQASDSGRIIIGTVEGDIHDIGKTIVATILSANGFDVMDIGADVKLEVFVEKAKEECADVICMSALLTTTMTGQKDVIEMLKKENIRDNIKVVIGGAPVDEKWAMNIGADGYGEDAVSAVNIIQKLLSN